MQENNERNKEIITIKVLASAAVLNLLAAGFTLIYSKNQNKEVEADPTKIATQVNPIYNEINDNSEYMSAINQNILYDMDSSIKPSVNPPYIPGTTDVAIPAPVENNVVAPKPTLGSPYKPGLTEDDLYTNSRTVPIPDEIAAKNTIYNEITNGTIPAPTEISSESMVREAQNPVYNEINGNSEYMSTINQNILYDLDPSIKPPVNPPYKPNEDSGEHTRSI